MTVNNTLEINSNALPKDLLISGQPDSAQKDKFQVVVPNLELDETYSFQFQYVFADGSLSQWSPGYVLLTPTEQVPGAPTATVTGGAGFIQVNLPTFPTNATRVDVRIAGGIFGDGTKVAESFSAAGTKTITAPGAPTPGLEYVVTLLTVTPTKINGDPSSPVTVFVTTEAEAIEAPTLPIGLTVNTEPFAVSVGWEGEYQDNETFSGFKSIDIHVRSSNLGSTATAGFSDSTLVASLTVDKIANRQNIGLDNLRLALGLAANQDVYNATPFFYYIARNDADGLYSVENVPTYTRINSTAVVPTKANIVDLESGLISIENLVAGNGRFTSWLRAGGSYTDGIFGGGTRIELSAVNDFTDPTNPSYTIEKGLTAYNSGNTKIFDLDLSAGTLTIEGSGKFTGDLEIGSGNNIFKAQPTTGIWLGHTNYVSAPFRVSTSGILTAASGTIGGWSITGSLLHSNTVGTELGKINLNPATPKIALLQNEVEKITIDPIEGIVGPTKTVTITRAGVATNITGAAFKITPGGNAELMGTIHAASGYIGAWQITGNSIIGGSSGPFTVGLKVAEVAPSTEVTLWSDAAKTTGFPEGVGNITIWAGSSEPLFGQGVNNVYTNALNATTGTDSPFYVTNTGFLKASKGRIGGWVLGYTQLWGGDPDTPSTIVGLQALRQSTEFYSIWAGGNGLTGGSANGGPGPNSPFSVTNHGNLRATNAYIRGEVLASSGGFGTVAADVNNDLYISQGWTINDPENGTIQSTGYSTGALKIRLEGTTGSIVGGNFYIGGNKTGDQLLSDGTVKLGNDSIRYTPSTSTFEINPQGRSFANFKIRLNVVSNEDGNFSDTTVVQDENGYLATGRALQYGGDYYPTDNGPSSYFDPDTGITYNYNYSGGAEDWKENIRNKNFVTGDLWFSTKA